MKKQFVMPSVEISKFISENIITTSGDNVRSMKKEMEGKGNTVTTKDLSVFTF